MSATAADLHLPAPAAQRRRTLRARLPAGLRTPVAVVGVSVLASRLLVALGAVTGALDASRQPGWSFFDQTRISQHLGSLGNTLGAAAVRWDSIHYLDIARHGYRGRGDAVFFPLYPLLIHAAGFALGSDVLAGALISLVCFAIAVGLLHRLTELELGRRAADATILLLCFAPLSLFFSAVYTESLFLALSLGSILAARERRLPLACLLAGLAALTRVPGILLVVPIALMCFRGEHLRPRRDLVWLLAIPGALAGFMLYLAGRGFGLMAPVAGQGGTQHGHRFTGPISALIDALRAAASGLGALLHGTEGVISPNLGGPLSISAESLVLLAVLALSLWALVLAARRLPLALSIYAGLALLVCVSSPVSGQPLVSLDRYVLTIFPLWMAAGDWLSRRRLTPVITAAGAGLLVFYAYAFATWAFVA